MLKKIGALITSLSVALAPASSLISSTVSRATIGALVGTSAFMLPSAAHAQSGSRVCAIAFGNGTRSGTLYLGMEVSKYDLVTCPAAWGTMAAISGAWSAGAVASAALRSAASGGKSFRLNQQCEAFTSDMGRNGDVCNLMTRYHIYSFFRGAMAKVT